MAYVWCFQKYCCPDHSSLCAKSMNLALAPSELLTVLLSPHMQRGLLCHVFALVELSFAET